MTIRAIHGVEPSPKGRAMTPDAVVEEITHGTRSRGWVLRHVPAACRVPQPTRPPLYWEPLVRAWWETGAVPKEAVA